jgi:limonene-1,2-epoxide hydrolase
MLQVMAKKTANTTRSEKKTLSQKKTTAKKTTAKKPTAKKTPAKKATAKKTPAKKATAKKAATTKPTAKKATAKKAATTTPTAKKATTTKAAGQPKAVAGAPHREDNVKVVKDFIAALERLDFDGALALCAPNVIWVNEPIKSAGSREQLGNVLRSMFGDVSLFRVENLQIGQDPDGTVYTDRIDIIRGGGLSMRLRVQGVFVVRNGQIVSWVDRFSWPDGMRQTMRCVPSILRFQLGKLRAKLS